MANRKRREPNEFQKREARIRAIQKSFPQDRDGIVERLKVSLQQYHSAFMADERETVSRIEEVFIAAVQRANNDSHVKSAEVMTELGEALRAADGDVPMWGQPGRFLVEGAGVVACVNFFGCWRSLANNGMSMMSVTPDKLWITPSGLREYLYEFHVIPTAGMTVADAARATLIRHVEVALQGKLLRLTLEGKQRAETLLEKHEWIRTKLGELERTLPAITDYVTGQMSLVMS